MEDLKLALSRAKVALMNRKDSAFFTTVCFSLKHEWDDTIPTAATNGTHIKFNTKFFKSLDTEERVFLLLHESMHVAYLHMGRLQDRNRKRWNIAADHVINLMLIERGFKMPKDGYADKQYAGMSTEQVYDMLPEYKDDPDYDSDLQEPSSSVDNLTTEVQDILVRAAVQSKLQDDHPYTIPKDIQIFLNRLLKPQLPWNRILQRYMNALSKADYSFRRPNRRFVPHYYIPSLYTERLMNIAVAVDTSGSVTDHEFNSFVSEIAQIFKTMNPEKISLIQFDTEIKSVTEVSNINALSKVIFTGRGGTLIGDVLDWAEENKPQLLLVFTDGHFPLFDHTTKRPLVWLVHNNEKFKPSFGKVINYSIKE